MNGPAAVPDVAVWSTIGARPPFSNFATRYIVRRCIVVVLVLVGYYLNGCGEPHIEQRTTVESDVEREAIAADQAVREAILQVRAMPPAQRDLTPLLDLLGGGLRNGAVEFYQELSSWRTSYEVDGQIDVLRRETRVVSDSEVIVITCERDWMNMIDVNGAQTDFRGGFAYARSVARTFRRAENGTWVNMHEGSDYEICKGVPSQLTR
jgi:hypothetical protein